MKFRRPRQAELSPNLTPLIDVVFLLLIFFMVSTTFTRETHLLVDLPEAVGEEGAPPRQVEIVISASGQYTVNERSLVNDRPDTLRRALEDVSEGDTSLPVVITADANTPHQAVVRAMDAAGQLGFVRLSLTTREPAGD